MINTEKPRPMMQIDMTHLLLWLAKPQPGLPAPGGQLWPQALPSSGRHASGSPPTPGSPDSAADLKRSHRLASIPEHSTPPLTNSTTHIGGIWWQGQFNLNVPS